MKVQIFRLAPLLIAAALISQGCATTQAGAQKMASTDPQVCQSKWIAAGNNGAKAGRYYQVSC